MIFKKYILGRSVYQINQKKNNHGVFSPISTINRGVIRLGITQQETPISKEKVIEGL